MGILYCFIFLKIKRLLANLLKTSSEVILTLLKFIKKKFAVGLFVSILQENKVVTNKPAANFFLMNFDKTKISSDEAFDKLANERLILRKMFQYKIRNSLRFTIGNNKENEHFIKTINNILK